MILPPLAASAKSGERHHGRRALIVRWCFAGLDLLALERAYGLAILSPLPLAPLDARIIVAAVADFAAWG
jgi:hypothetical protein